MEGFDELTFLHSGLDVAKEVMEASGYGPEFVVWQLPEQRERKRSYGRAKRNLASLMLSSEVFHIFSIGANGRRDLHCPFSYMVVDKTDAINRFLIYFSSGSSEPLGVIEQMFGGRFCNGYLYKDDVLDSPPGYFAGVDYVGLLGEGAKPPFKEADRIGNWRGNIWGGIDARLGYVTEIFEINIWSEATLDFPLGSGTVRSYLQQNPIGKIGTSCGKFMIRLNDNEQQELRRVFDGAKICLAGFDGNPPIDLDQPRWTEPTTH